MFFSKISAFTTTVWKTKSTKFTIEWHSFESHIWYSCNKISTTWIQISRQNWNRFFSSASHQIMMKILDKKNKQFKCQKNKKLGLKEYRSIKFWQTMMKSVFHVYLVSFQLYYNLWSCEYFLVHWIKIWKMISKLVGIDIL